MNRFVFVLVALLFTLTLGDAPAQTSMLPNSMPGAAATKAAPYFDGSAIDLKALLGDPPPNGSPETLKEIDLILQEQATRTPEDVKRIKREAKHLNVWLFDTVLGSWFNAKNLPETTVFFARVEATEYPIIMSGKKFWNRQRPPLQDSRVHPAVPVPKNASYPSGHATVGDLYGMILAQMAPDLEKQLIARGRQIGDDRVLAGVHFPSDVAAGEKVATTLYQKLTALPEFEADLAKAKAEISAARH